MEMRLPSRLRTKAVRNRPLARISRCDGQLARRDSSNARVDSAMKARCELVFCRSRRALVAPHFRPKLLSKLAGPF
jgi:hypothetical protein